MPAVGRTTVADPDGRSGEEGIVAQALARWLAPPQVLADPHQSGDPRGVWTRACDVLPGVLVRRGIPLTAVWEDLSWTGIPEWDDGEVDVLWLRPHGDPVRVPEPRSVYRDEARDRARPDCPDQEDCAATVSPATTAPPHLGGLLDDVLADFAASLKLLMNAVRSDRRVAQELLTAIAALPGRERDRLMSAPPGQALLRMARRAGLPGEDRAS